MAATISLGDVPGGYLATLRIEGEPGEVQMLEVGGDEDFLKVYGIELVAGRNIERRGEFLLNQAAVAALGGREPIGRHIDWVGEDLSGPVVDVVRDFHTSSLHEPIRPTFIAHAPYAQSLTLRLRPEGLSETMTYVRGTYERRVEQEFYGLFLDDRYQSEYQQEQRLKRILVSFTALAVLVACLGMVGLATFAAKQRTREIGIRKVLGASIAQVAVTLCADFPMVAAFASLLAWLLGWYTMGSWLEGYAYRVDLGLGTFLLGMATALAVVLVAVSAQALRAAASNPAEAVRHE